MWEANEALMFINLAWCYIMKGPEESRILGASSDETSQVGLTDGKRYVKLIKCFEIEKIKEIQSSIYKRASEALDRVPAYGLQWWKIAYRWAQVLQCTLEPQEAMKEIEHARRYAQKGSPLHDAANEAESALRQIDLLETAEVKKVLMEVDKDYLARDKQKDGKPQGARAAYLQSGFTPLPTDHPRAPMALKKEEMLAVRLLATTELVQQVQRVNNNGAQVRSDEEKINPSEEFTKLLKKILSTVAQPPSIEFLSSNESGTRTSYLGSFVSLLFPGLPHSEKL